METTRLTPRTARESRRGGLALRYGAAAIMTLLSVGGAALVSPPLFCWVLALVAVVGVGVAFGLRRSGERIGGKRVPRLAWNGAILLVTTLAALYHLATTTGDIWALALAGELTMGALVRWGVNEPMIVLIQLFSLFAAFRSFALLSERDVTLTAVPTFSVLLLLVPLQRDNPVVVLLFLGWTLMTAILLALEHRVEQRRHALLVLAPPQRAQSDRLAARSLAWILGLSLFSAVAVAGYLTSSDADERSKAETAVVTLVARFSSFAFGANSVNNTFSVERQIDFSERPATPSRRELWRVLVATLDNEVLRPSYWRLFSLSNYNGRTWSQSSETFSVPLRPLQRSQWPLPTQQRDYEARVAQLRQQGRVNADTPPYEVPLRGVRLSIDRRLFPGYVVAQERSGLRESYGAPRAATRQLVEALAPNIGFVPHLPAPISMIPMAERDNWPESLRVRPDGGLEIGLMEPQTYVRVLSSVPAFAEYGLGTVQTPNQSVAAKPDSPRLNRATRRANLALPLSMPARVKTWARNHLDGINPDASNAARARRLAWALMESGTYTLRPPSVPEGRDATDFFLFDGSRRGYCTHFASALAVLCRTQGIPARVVSGFATPEYQVVNGPTYGVIREADAHAWTEVWVENWGWALVDATPPDDRGDNAPDLWQDLVDRAGAALDGGLRWASNHGWMIALAVAAIIGPLALWRTSSRWLPRVLALRRERSDLTQVERRLVQSAYLGAARRVQRRFRPRAEGETPREWLQAAQQALGHDLSDLDALTTFYERARFAPQGLESGAVESALRLGRGFRLPRSTKRT